MNNGNASRFTSSTRWWGWLNRLPAGGPYDEALFEELRQLRKELADAEGKPPYIVFGDASLVQMAREKPLSEQDLLQIHGVGQHKLEKYGMDFLDAITQYCMSSEGTAAESP